MASLGNIGAKQKSKWLCYGDIVIELLKVKEERMCKAILATIMALEGEQKKE